MSRSTEACDQQLPAKSGHNSSHEDLAGSGLVLFPSHLSPAPASSTQLSVWIPYKVASLRGESSNQLLETLEEWNDYLERYSAPPTSVAILSARRCRVSKGFPGSFGLYLDESRRQARRQ